MALSGAQRSQLEAMLSGPRSAVTAQYDAYTRTDDQRRLLQERADKALRLSHARLKSPAPVRDLLLATMLLEEVFS